MGDIILYKKIINTLARAGYEIPDWQISRHFSNISKDDYCEEEKQDIIDDIKNTKNRLLVRFKNTEESSERGKKSFVSDYLYQSDRKCHLTEKNN